MLGTVAAAALQGDRARPLDAWAVALVVAAAAATLVPRRIAPVWALAATMAVVSA
ncbi:hypothetical protein [Pseudonocardia sp. GCM10023141]|uniref:hypothetical protein n=1 Tax=Pseudonocardia sp. GCM10023141 TaxID=3252653 RepID=UPI003622BD67